MRVLSIVEATQPWGHGERRRDLERQFPGWEIWYVPRGPASAAWYARPRMLVNADSPEELTAGIRAAHGQIIPDPVLLAAPRGYPARVRRRPWLEQSAGAAWRRMKARRRRPARRARSAPGARLN